MASDLLSFSCLWPTLASRVSRVAHETCPLRDALGRVTRSSLSAAWPLPRFDASAMDGVAVDSARLRPSLRLASQGAYATPGPPQRLAPGEAMPIGTGAPLPYGADAVVPRERTTRDGDQVRIEGAVRAGDNVRYRGEESSEGEEIVPEGAILTPGAVAAALAAGVQEAKVSRLVRVEVVTTGSELVEAGLEKPAEGQVIDTNGLFLASSLSGTGYVEVLRVRRVPDEVEATRDALAEALSRADLVVVSGGVSVGDRDLVKALLEQELGVERVFWRVAQKPGKPLFAGTHAGGWVLGLPGNPGAVATAHALVIAPLLRALAGVADPWPRLEPVALGEPLQPDPRRTLLRWARIRLDSAGLVADPVEKSGSHMLGGLVGAELLLIVPPGSAPLDPGAQVPSMRIRP